jgi:hypothetical protein
MNGETYLANSDRLLIAHPQALAGLRHDALRVYTDSRYVSAQLFASNNFMGSVAHFGLVDNCFFQIEGTKHWFIVDPAFAYLSYPVLTPVDGNSALSWMGDADAERCPLFRYCPRYEVTLEPGEVLYNPMYWTHAVRNLSTRSVGVATRWVRRSPDQRSSCRLFDLALHLNPARIENAVNAMVAMVGREGEPLSKAWFEKLSHGRRYGYNAEMICSAWRVRRHGT